MALRFHFSELRSRATQLRLVLIAATLLGMLACLPLWLNTRRYPLLPVGAWMPILPSPWDMFFLIATLASLVVAARFRRAVPFFLAALLFMYLADQNRGQPWLYMYWVLLALTLAPEAAALSASRVVLSAVYLWAGLQKCHPKFFQVVPRWFAAPATGWHWPPEMIRALEWAVAAAPAIEIFIGVALWVPRLRRTALVTATVLHVLSLVFLGPLGHNYNLVVWPWNLAMLALLFVLFPGASPPRVTEAFAQLRRSKPALALTASVCLLPALSFFGKWDSYFSFSLYAANLAASDLFVTETLRERLPAHLQKFVHPVKGDYDPNLQGPFIVDQLGWSNAELRTPPLPEPRAFRAVFDHFAAYATNANELRMIVEPRYGPVTFYRTDGRWTLDSSRAIRK